MHEEEVKTLVSEALQANEAEHAADMQHLRSQCEDCEADLKERDRYGYALLRHPRVRQWRVRQSLRAECLQ